jgi:hypothetical protein
VIVERAAGLLAVELVQDGRVGGSVFASADANGCHGSAQGTRDLDGSLDAARASSGFKPLNCSYMCGAKGTRTPYRTWEMALELRFLSFGVVMRVLRFLRICVGVLRDVTVLDRFWTNRTDRKG